MPSCVYRKCTNYDTKVNKAQGISYHMFPTDEIQLVEWVAIVRKQRSEPDWIPSKSSRICTNHFHSSDIYVSNKGRTLLKRNAVPFIEGDIFEHMQNSPTSLDNVSVDMQEILETPKEAALQERVCQLTNKQKMLTKRNKILLQQNKRLKKRIDSLTKMLRDLRPKEHTPKEKDFQLNVNNEFQDLLIVRRNRRSSSELSYASDSEDFPTTSD